MFALGPSFSHASCFPFVSACSQFVVNPILGGVILQFVAAIFGSVLLAVLTIHEGGTSYLNYDYMGLLWACCAGLAVGTAEMLSFCVSGLGVPATQSIPTIIGGSVLFVSTYVSLNQQDSALRRKAHISRLYK
jgi:hypothetical protein